MRKTVMTNTTDGTVPQGAMPNVLTAKDHIRLAHENALDQSFRGDNNEQNEPTHTTTERHEIAANDGGAHQRRGSSSK